MAKVPLPSTPDSWIELEAAYTSSVHAAGAPVPQLLGLERHDGRRVGIYERVGGRSMWSCMVDQPAAISRLTRTLADLQAQVIGVVPPVFIPRQHDRLTCKIRAAAARRASASLLDALHHVDAGDTGRRLCHGDLHPGNVLLATDGPVLIDWFDVSRGDPVADVARTLLLVSPDANGPGGPAHLPGATAALLSSVRETYLEAIGEWLDLDALDRWKAVAAVARLAEGVEPQGLEAIWERWHRAAPLIGAR